MGKRAEARLVLLRSRFLEWASFPSVSVFPMLHTPELSRSLRWKKAAALRGSGQTALSKKDPGVGGGCRGLTSLFHYVFTTLGAGKGGALRLGDGGERDFDDVEAFVELLV